jgi:branched-chain amino acid transport system substrate-binding protein
VLRGTGRESTRWDQPAQAHNGEAIDMVFARIVGIGVLTASLMVASAGAPAWAQNSPPPLRIGINTPTTGAFADSNKPTEWADKLWESEINARGGLLGRKVELTFVDNKSNPEDAVAIYQRMLQDKYDFIFENAGSLIVQRESTLAEQHKKLFLAANGFAQALYLRGYKYLFYTGSAVSEDLNIGLAKLLEAMPVATRPKSVGFVTLENIAFTSLTKGFQEMVKPLNLETVLDITYPPNLSDATPLVANLQQKAPDMVFQTGLVNDTVLFARAAAQQNLRPKLLVIGLTAGAQPNFLASVGEAGEGMVYSAPWDPSLKTLHNKEFVEGYEKAQGVLPTYNAAQGYARWQIFEQAVAATKSFDDDVLREHLLSHSFDTVVGPIKYNPKGYSAASDSIVTQFHDGKRVVVWPNEQKTGELIYPRAVK